MAAALLSRPIQRIIRYYITALIYNRQLIAAVEINNISIFICHNHLVLNTFTQYNLIPQFILTVVRRIGYHDYDHSCIGAATLQRILTLGRVKK
ncbi:hypothetical protein D3C75_821430 [compost metagenome]